MKEEWIYYDIIISNLGTNVEVVLLNPDLIYPITTMDSVMNITKFRDVIALLLEITPNVLTVLEGDAWKKRRKMLSSVFNWNNVESQIPEINTICDKVFEKY